MFTHLFFSFLFNSILVHQRTRETTLFEPKELPVLFYEGKKFNFYTNFSKE